MSHIDEGTLHSYLDGEVSERQRTEIEGHLATCEQCQAKLEAAEVLSGRAAELLAELEPGAVQPPSWLEIEERAEARRRAEAQRLAAPRPVRLRPGLAWAASIALAFAVGWASQAYFFRTAASDFGARETVVGALDTDRSQAPELRQRGGAAPGEAQPEAARQEQSRASEPDMTAIQPRAKVTPEEEAATESAGRALEGAPAQRLRDDQPAELADELVVVEAPPAVAGIDVAREEAEPQAAVPVDRALPQPAAHAFEAQRTLAERRDAEAKSSGFVELPADDAALWLGKELRTLPELTLQRVEVGPGAGLEGAQPGLPAIRLVYEDAAGNEIILTQQWVGGVFEAFAETAPAMTVEPSGHRAYRWLDDQGYLLILEGDVSGDSLRALAERLR